MKIKVKSGYLSHNGELFGKGCIVDIDDVDIVKELSDNEQFEILDGISVENELASTEDAQTNDSTPVDSDEIEDISSLPDADLTKAVKK